MAWKALSSWYPLSDRWIRVRAEACQTERGTLLDPYYTFEYPDFVHVLAFTADGQVILVEQYRHAFGGLVLELPGGMADPGDVGPVEAGMRELLEETGYTGEEAHHLMAVSPDPARMRNRLHLIHVPLARPVTSQSLDPGESINVRTFHPSALLDLVGNGGFANASHAGLVAAGLLRLKLIAFDKEPRSIVSVR